MKSFFRGMNMFRELGNAWPNPSPSEIITGQTKVDTSGTPVQLSVNSTPLRCGIYFASGESSTTKKHYIGTTANKPTYDSGASGAKSSGQAVSPVNPVFWECDNISDVWIDCNDDDRTLTYWAY